MERRTALADVRNASRKRTAKREELLRQTYTAIALGAAGEAPAARFVLKSQQPGDGSPAPARTGCDGR